jgi:hypothetical protein
MSEGTPDRIDADRMSRALRAQGCEVTIAGLPAKAIGTGQVGDTFRYTMDYAGTPSSIDDCRGPAPAGPPRIS